MWKRKGLLTVTVLKKSTNMNIPYDFLDTDTVALIFFISIHISLRYAVYSFLVSFHSILIHSFTHLFILSPYSTFTSYCSCHKITMKRRGRSPTKKSRSTNAILDGEMIDTDDQELLIRSLEEEAHQQSQLFQKAFAAVGGFAMVISLLVYPFLCHEECSQRLISCWTHAIVSCVTHGLSIQCSRCRNRKDNCDEDEQDDDDKNNKSDEDDGIDPMILAISIWKTKLFQGAVVLNLLPLLLWIVGFFDQDLEHFHLGLVLGNVVTLVGAFLLLWDVQSTRQALDELNGAKYEHKSL